MPTWIRVRDDITGAEYDIEQSALRGGVTPVEGYPAVEGDGARPRPDKPYVGKDGLPATPPPRTRTTPEPEGDTTTEPDNTANTPAQPADIKE